ncbi:hypothetical protein K9N68_21410 [Kovacikia minuta CCNUW1]|nr:hypothetical protein [Kovacikia minuta]UBF24257.1 hypothetical protein K9N68_21410 [Kovacikia minuta CCNUW1]
MKVFALVDCNNFYVSCERVSNVNLRAAWGLLNRSCNPEYSSYPAQN